jgi:pantothenate kinase
VCGAARYLGRNCVYKPWNGYPEKRLIDRWLSYGMDNESAQIRAFGNDIPNAKNVIENSLPANILIKYQ